jgi:hypothetical protein
MKQQTFKDRFAEIVWKYEMNQRDIERKTGVHFVTINRLLNVPDFEVGSDTARRLAESLPCSKAERDELVRLSGRVPSDVEQFLIANPEWVEKVREAARG